METSHNTISQPWKFPGKSLDYVWEMESWDPLKVSTPPWEHRGIWYSSGIGDYVVFAWKEAYCDISGEEVICGEISRGPTLRWADEIYTFGCDDTRVLPCVGVYLFHRYELLKQNGGIFPEELGGVPGKWW